MCSGAFTSAIFIPLIHFCIEFTLNGKFTNGLPRVRSSIEEEVDAVSAIMMMIWKG